MSKKTEKRTKIFQVRIPTELDRLLRIYMVGHDHKSKNEALVEIIRAATKDVTVQV